MGSLRDEWWGALRSLRRSPGHTATCVALLAVGIASTTAILGVGNALLRRPLPVRHGDRALIPYGSDGGDKRLLASVLDAEAWATAPSLEAFAVARMAAVTLDVDGEPERIDASVVEADYFDVLGVAPVLGRTFTADEAREQARVAVLGHGLWQRRFGSDPGVLGQPLRLDDESWQVIGVMPRGYDQPYGSEIWRPLDLDSVEGWLREASVYDPVARLKPGHTIDQARAELTAIADRLAKEHPDSNAGWTARALPLRESLMQDPNGMVERSVDLALWGSVLLLLIAVANVVQLQIVRTSERQLELGTRLAIGGTRSSLARMLALEALAMTALAAAFAVPLAWGISRAVLRLSPVSPTAFASHLVGASFDAGVLAVAAAVVLLVGLASAVYPALRASRTEVAPLLSGGARSGVGRSRRLFLEQAVLAQVAVTVALLSATGVLGESYGLLLRMDLGFRPEGVSYYGLSLSPRDYESLERRAQFAEALAEGAGGLPGVSAAFTTDVPLAPQSWIAGFGCEGRDLPPGQELYTADRFVSPGYLETLGVPLVAGRTITDRDDEDTELVAVINESLAEECFPGEEAVGRRVQRITRSGAKWLRVVGVVADTRELRVSFRSAHTAWYLPYRQHDVLRDVYLVIRGDASPARIRALVKRLDPHQPVAAPVRLQAHLEHLTGSDRVAALVMGYFAVVSVLLAVVGVHGSMRRYVAQQRRAIGTRMAFGAAPRRILGLVVGRALLLAGLGALVGTLGGIALQRLSAGFVFGAVLGAPERLALTAVAAFALAVAACGAPAYRASRTDPAFLLRE